MLARHNKQKLTLTILTLSTLTSLTPCAKVLDATQFQSVPDSEKNNPRFATNAPPPKTLKKLPPEVKQKLSALITKTKKNMVFVKGGSFQMGDFGMVHSPDGAPYTSDSDNKPLHKVTLDSYSINAYKTSYADVDVYTAATGQPKVGMQLITKIFRMPSGAAGINWSVARHYCQWLGNQVGVPMDLPTEAQWEYAARSRGKAYIYGTNNGQLEDGVNIWSRDQRLAASGKYRTNLRVSDLGKFPPNPIGLYDVATDNYEWIRDWYGADYYKTSPENNPSGPATGTKKVLRSTKPAAGNDIMMGDGMTMRRSHEAPNLGLFENDAEFNQNYKHSVRCVALSTTPLN